MTRLVVLVVVVTLVTGVPRATSAAITNAPKVTAVEIVSPHRLPEARVRAAVGDLQGRPRLRGAVRESLERLWALGLFSEAQVEEVPEPGGVRLRFHLQRLPYVESLDFRGDLGLEAVDLIAAAGLGLGDSAPPERIERARQDVLALYRREGYRQSTVAVQTVPDPATNALQVTFAVDAGAPARIGDVEIRGVRRASPRAVRRAFGLREGDRLREVELRAAAERARTRLREDGFPEAKASVEPGAGDADTNRVPVVLEVDEGPRLALEIEGATAVREPAIRERLTFAQTGIVDDVELGASVRQVEELYRERGHPSVAVGGAIRREGDDIVVRLSIVEGPYVSVESVELPGATAVPADRLRAQLETRPPGFLRRGPFVQKALERDVLALTAFLRARGYPEARIGPAQATFSEDGTQARVVIPIDEGPHVVLGSVAVRGHTLFAEGELLAALPVRPGEPWSEPVVEEGRRLLERRYARRGYHGVTIAARSTRRDATVDVAYTIAEGQLTRIGRLVVRGLTRTSEHVVRRELPFRPGDPLDPEALVEAQRRLSLLGIFERVEVEPLRPPTTPYADVTVTVREGQPWYVAAGVGYSTFEGVRGFMEGGHDNLFGTGRSLGVRLRASERNNRGEVFYREPWLFGTPWRGEASIFHEFREEIGYDLERTGGAVGVERELLTERIRGLRVRVGYALSLVDRFDIDDTLIEADVTPGREIIASVTPELTLDRRDRPFDPRRGSFHRVSLELGGVFVGGEADFVKSRAETVWLFDRWVPSTVFAFGARLGLAAALLDSETLPIEERFFAGGATTVRGYRERRLGPLDARSNPTGGNVLVVLNAEWRFPIWRWLGGAVFYDVGAVTPEVADFALDELKSGAGAGLRVATPVGPLRLDVGYPLDRVAGEERKVRFYISVGYPF